MTLSLPDQVDRLLQGPEPGVDLPIVGDVVSTIVER